VLDPASTVVGEHLHDPAGRDLPAPALADHPDELTAQHLEPSDLRLDRGKVAARDAVGFRAVAFRLVGKVEQRSDLGDIEPKAARMANEVQSLQVRCRVAPVVAVGASRAAA